MSLPVPLSVRVGDRHITREVKSLAFRREAIGGVRSISFGLARPLSDLEGLEPLSEVYVYDTRSAATVAQGRLADTGRTASADGGQSWDVVAFGPAQHASDITTSIIYVDRLHDGWQPNRTTTPSATFGTATVPNLDNYPCLMGQFPDGAAFGSAGPSLVTMVYDRLWNSGQTMARFDYSQTTGTAASWRLDALAATNGEQAVSDAPGLHNFGGAPGSHQHTVSVAFAQGRNTPIFRVIYVGSGSGTIAGDNTYAWVTDVAVLGTRFLKTGAASTAYSNNVVWAHEVVADLLGRVLHEFDGANATIATNTFQMQQLAYPDGVTAEQVLSDLMTVEPAYRWYTTPDTGTGSYGFRWEAWPTTVRYEATLDDGGSFPLSTQGIYNAVMIRWRGINGSIHTTYRTRACPVLDDAGLTRQGYLDLGTDLGTQAQAEQAGDAFLKEHNAPKNSGTLTVARPIRDVITGAMVDPWEIEAGELVRILGVEAYPDAFNASTNDGQGVFRIFAVDYTSEGNVATLALDSDPRETADALVKLLKQRSRR